MKRRTRAMLTAVIAFVGALFFLGLTVYPFQYGPVESAILVVVFVGLAVFEFVLEESSF